MEELEYISERIQTALEFDMVPEVIHYALRYMKQNPMLTIEEAIDWGCSQWNV